MMKGLFTTKRLALAALAGICCVTTVTAAAAKPAAIQDTNISSDSPSNCTVYYMSTGDALNIRGRVRPLVVPLNENDRGKHDFGRQRNIILALAPDCPMDVFCTLYSNSSRSSPFGGRHILDESIGNVTRVECGPLVEFVDEDNGESGDDGYGKGNYGESIIRQHIGERDDLEAY